MSFDGIKRAALERITAGSEGARLIGSQLTGVTGSNIQVLLEALLARSLPSGGTTGQALTKSSNTDYAVGWATGSGDLLATLQNAEVSLTGVVTLTSTAFGKMHVCSGASIFTVNMPAVSGNTGKIIGIRVAATATLTAVTVDPNASELIDGAATKTLQPGDSAILYCTGTAWSTFAARRVPASGDYNAGQITNAPAGNIAATTVQAALNELDTEKATPGQIPVVSSQAQADAGTDDATFLSPLKGANMLRISPTEVSVTGATTLATSAFGKMHNCSGTTADYTVGLPTAVSNAGKIIAIRGDAGLTKVVTLDANSTETIGGNLTKAIVARQKTIIVSDGSNWYILHDYRLPPAVVSGGAWSQSQTITAGQINAFISTSPAISVTVPALGPAPEGYSWRIMLLGGTRWTTVGTGTPLLLLSFDGTGIHGGSLWPGNQTFLAWNALMTPATLTGSNTYTLQLFATVATSYTLVSGTLIAQPVLV